MSYSIINVFLQLSGRHPSLERHMGTMKKPALKPAERIADGDAEKAARLCLRPRFSTFSRIFQATFWIALLAVSTVVHAQPAPRFDMRFHFISQAEIEDMVSGLEEAEGLKLEVASLDLLYTYPLVLGWTGSDSQQLPTRQLLNRFTFRKENIEVDEDTPITSFQPAMRAAGARELAFKTENFIRLGYEAVYLQRLSSRWQFTGIGGTQLSVNDLDGAGLGDLAFRAGVLLDYSTRSGWTLGLGALYAQLTGENAIVPLVHLEKANRGQTWKLELRVPRVSLWYHPRNSAVEYGLLGELDGSEYRLLDRKATLYDRRGQIVEEDADVSLAYSVFTLGPAAKLTEAQGISAFLQLGMAASRRYDFRAPDENETLAIPADAPLGAGEKLDFKLKRAAFVQGNLQYRFDASPSATAAPSLLRQDLLNLLRPRSLGLMGLGIGGAVLAHQLDDELKGEVSDSQPFTGIMDAGNYYGSTTYGLLAIGSLSTVSRVARIEPLQPVASELLRALALSNFVVSPLKFSIARERPDGSNRFSFPSGHSANSFALTAVLARRYGWRLGVPLYAFTAMVPAARINDQKHFFSDVFGGAVLGTIAGWAVTRSDEERVQVSVAPARGSGIPLLKAQCSF